MSNKFMIKRLLALVLALSMICLASACSSLFSSNSKPAYYDGTLVYDYDSSVEKRIEDNFESFEKYFENEDLSDSKKMQTTFEVLQNDIYYVGDQANLAYIEFMKDTSDSEMMDQYNNLHQKYSDYLSKLIRYYKVIYDSVYKDDFYENWTEKDIKDALRAAEIYTDEFVECNNVITELTAKYKELDQSSSTFIADSAAYYYDIVQNNMKLAKLAGYDSYPEYAYEEVYYRDYSTEDVRKMYDYVENYLVPLSSRLKNELIAYNKINDVIKISNSFSGNTISGTEGIKSTFGGYLEKFGRDTVSYFDLFLKNYTATSSKSAYPGAFTVFMNSYSIPVCYFGPGYQNTLTYIHEFGHFNALCHAASSVESIDLCEVHSQGNEWLYLSYISENYGKTKFDYLAKYTLYNDLLTVILSTCCDAFEQYVYAHPELDKEDYDEVFVEMATEMGAYDYLFENMMGMLPEEYWHYSIVSSSMYYISYAVSMLPTLELFINAQQNGLDVAIEMYKKIIDISYNAGFVETLKNAGLSDPFSISVYKKIYNYFK